MEKLYKVLENGKSCHGGNFEWSLPNEQIPGAYHEHVGELKKCYSGFHLTRNPVYWFNTNCQVFLAEAQGETLGMEYSIVPSYDKIVCRKVRLIRQLSNKELEEFQIFYDGIHEVRTGIAFACGTSVVNVYGDCIIYAYNNSVVNVYNKHCIGNQFDFSIVNIVYGK